MPRKPSKITTLDRAMALQDEDDKAAIEAVANEMIEWIKGRTEGNYNLPIKVLKRQDMLSLAMAAVSRWVVVRSHQEAMQSDPIDDLWRPSQSGDLSELLG